MGDIDRGAWFKFVERATNKEVDCSGFGWKYMISADNAVYKHSILGMSDSMDLCPNIEARVFSGVYIGGHQAFIGDTIQRFTDGCLSATGMVFFDRVRWKGQAFTPLGDFATLYHETYAIVDGDPNG